MNSIASQDRLYSSTEVGMELAGAVAYQGADGSADARLLTGHPAEG
jgi:hypothetical protein